jgi:hypothetical protein
MLNWEINQFVNNWMERANEYGDDEIHCYDKFFTLFLVFNRLYVEAALELNRQGISVYDRRGYLGDQQCATKHTLAFIGQDRFDALFESYLSLYVEQVAVLIENQVFFINLKPPEGLRQPTQDRKLVNGLRSVGKKRALAVLTMIYKIRCNLFHGHKSFDPIQANLLNPINKVLGHITETLHRRLQE